MDSIRSVSVFSMAQFVVLGAMTPAFAELSDDDTKQHRPHGHSHIQAVSHSRADYPVIWNWMPAPEQTDSTGDSDK